MKGMKAVNEKTTIGIIGLGYVGLKELVSFASANEIVIGYDINIEKIETLQSGKSPIGTVSDKEIHNALAIGCRFTDDYWELSNCKFIIIAVPTPLNENNDPDITYIKSAFRTIKEFFDCEKQIIILESTTYPGCSTEMINEYFPGQSVNYAFCGEREDPGGQCSFRDIPRVLGASSRHAFTECKSLYEKIVVGVHEVSKPEIAEITKLYENIYRSVNIGLANEFKILCHRMGIDPYEVINAAKTKPFGFRAFFPGPGLGGHCIPIDPFYLSWSAKKYDLNMQFIELSGIVNSQMPYYVIKQLGEVLNKSRKSINGSKILACGIAYKKDIEDTRNSPAGIIIDELNRMGADIYLYDPVVSEYSKEYKGYVIMSTIEKDYRFDAALILTDHSNMSKDSIVNCSDVVIDTRGSIEKGDNVYYA